MSIVSFSEALDIVRTHAGGLTPSAVEAAALLDSANRVLAEDVKADRDQPPFDRSTRDGFAVRAHDWNSGRPLHVAGQVRAGEVWHGGELPPGSAVEIMTGAPVPAGADAVGMVEHAVHSGEIMTAAPERNLEKGDNIVARGREAREGTTLVARGTLVNAAEIAMAASCGRTTLAVYERPSVAIAATGDELVGIDERPEPHQIRNSNTYGIAALVSGAGGIPRPLRVAGDVRGDIQDRIEQGIASDLLVLSGGVSAGKYDLVEEVLAALGAEFLFTGVRMQPGRPVVFGRLPSAGFSAGEPNWRYFFGLPGNPVSTQVTFHCFVEPFLGVLAGLAWRGPRFGEAALAHYVGGRPGITRLLPAVMTPGLEKTEVRLISWQGSGDLAANARANCYAVLREGTSSAAGDRIPVLLR